MQIKQQRCGYRFSLDAVLLAAHLKPRPRETVLDLGTGCGIIALILAYRNPRIKIIGVELQPELAQIAADNVKANDLSDQIEIRCADLRRLTSKSLGTPINAVICNPPYRAYQSGRINPDPQKAVAMHELKATLADIVRIAGKVLQPAGTLLTLYPAERTADLLLQLKKNGLEPKYLRTVHSRPGADARRVLIKGVKGGRSGLTIAAPLVVHTDGNDYSPEVEQMFLSGSEDR